MTNIQVYSAPANILSAGVYPPIGNGTFPLTTTRFHRLLFHWRTPHIRRRELITAFDIWISLERSYGFQSKMTDDWLKCCGRWYQKLQLKLKKLWV